jgi:hypothetical protein
MNANKRIHIILNKYAYVFRMSHVVNLKNVFFHFVVSNYVCLFSLHEKNVWWLFFVLYVAYVIWEICFVHSNMTVVLFSSRHFKINSKRMDCRRCSCCHLIYASVSIFYQNKIIFCLFLTIVVRLKNKNTLSSLLNL